MSKFFSKFGILVLLLAGQGALAQVGTPSPVETFCDTAQSACYPIIQGPSSADTAQFLVIVPRRQNPKIQVTFGDQKIGSLIESFEANEYPGLHWKTLKYKVSGLKPNTNYQLQIIPGSKSPADQRNLKTLDTTKSKAHFAFGSCMSDDWRYDSVKTKVWGQIMSHDPDFFVLVGDLVYVDSFDFVAREAATEQDIWIRYLESFRNLPLFQLKNLKPVFATWDDHDFGTNDGNRYFIARDAAIKTFRAFFRFQEIAGVYQPGQLGVESSFQGFGQQFILLDNRSFREKRTILNSPAESGPNGKYDYLGQDQHNWMMSELSKNSAPAWIMGGNQFFGTREIFDKKESLEGDFPNHFSQMMSDLAKIPKTIAFGSGDIHFSEVMKIEESILGYETLEVTSSAAHAFMFGETTEPGWANPRRIAGIKKANLMIINSEVIGQNLQVETYSVDVDGKKDIQVQSLIGREKKQTID